MGDVDPKFLEFNGGALTATAATFLVLTYISVALRSYVRGVLTKGFLADDWLMLVSQAVFTVSCLFIIIGVRAGLGRHNRALPQAQEIEALKWQALATASYVLNMMFIKLSIAVFLLRIATEKKYTYTIWISATVVLIWSLVIFFWNLFQCSPVEAQWDFTIPNKRCVSSQEIVNAAYAISVMTILTDWLYALLPIPMIWKVKMTQQAKATVVVILGLGVFASIATLIRLKFLADLNDIEDILFAGTDAMVWTLIEPGVAIMASSLVTIRPLLRKMRLPGFLSTENTGMSGPTGGQSKRSGHLRSGTNVSSGRMPGFGPGDLTLIDIETGGVGGGGHSPLFSQTGKKGVASGGGGGGGGLRVVTRRVEIRRDATAASPAVSAADYAVDIGDDDVDRDEARLSRQQPPAATATAAGPPPASLLPISKFVAAAAAAEEGPRASVRSETFLIEGRMVGDPPTPGLPSTTGPAYYASSPSPLARPAWPPPSSPGMQQPGVAPGSVHSEDHEAAETHSQHDGGGGDNIPSDFSLATGSARRPSRLSKQLPIYLSFTGLSSPSSSSGSRSKARRGSRQLMS